MTIGVGCAWMRFLRHVPAEPVGSRDSFSQSGVLLFSLAADRKIFSADSHDNSCDRKILFLKNDPGDIRAWKASPVEFVEKLLEKQLFIGVSIMRVVCSHV